MHYCPRCRAEIAAEARFCTVCGYDWKSQQFIRPAFLPAKKSPTPSLEQALHHPKIQPQQPPLIENQSNEPLSVEAGAVKARPQVIGSHDDVNKYEHISESYVAASRAAEQWRTSWRKRQREEAGPATSVSRGQSPVPEPLMAMQHSLARIRAIIAPASKQDQQKASPGFWTAIFLMVCLIGGLGAFIASTYLPTTNNASAIHVAAPTETPAPVLSLQGPQVASIFQGQTLHLHGENFDAGAPIIFTLDGTTAIGDTSGRQISLEASDLGSFDVAIPTSTWSLREHLIQAENNKSGQSAYMNIQIMLKDSIPATHSDLGLSITTKLIFQAVVGQKNPSEQFVTLTNKNPGTPLQWMAIATADNNLSWLAIDPATTGGTLSIRGKDTIGISVNSAGLQSNTTLYAGKIVFTINQMEQLTLPVELQMRDAAAELVVTPNPLVGTLVQAGGTCQANTLLVLVNISHTPMSWNLSMDDATRQHVQFMAAGMSIPHGQLAPSGQNGDTQVLTLMCIHVQNGDTYHVLVNADNISWPVTVSIQAKP